MLDAASGPFRRQINLISGKETEYENWIANQYMPAFRQTNPIGHTMARGVFGDNVSNFYHAVPVANWAALDAGDPVERQVGARRMEQTLNGLDGIVESSALIVARIRYDLMGENQNWTCGGDSLLSPAARAMVQG